MKVQNSSAYLSNAAYHFVPVLPGNNKFRGALRKRHRTHFTSHQVEKMEDIFSQTTNPHRELVVQLSAHLSLIDKNILIWFKNRRAKVKRQLKTTDNVEKPEIKTRIPNKEVSLHENLAFKLHTEFVSQNCTDSSFISNRHGQSQIRDIPYQLPPFGDNQREVGIWMNKDHHPSSCNSKFNGYLPLFQNQIPDACGNNQNYYRELSAPTPCDYEMCHPTIATSGNTVESVNGYNYPENYSSSSDTDTTLSSSAFSPTYDVPTTSFDSFNYLPFPAVSNMSSFT